MSVMTAENFIPHTGKIFQGAGAPVALALVKVERHPCGFVLLFQGPARPVLREGTYEFAIEDGGAASFHIMPVHTPIPGHQDYQAIFN